MPHEILELEPEQVTLAVMCLNTAAEETARRVREIRDSEGMVFRTLGVEA